MLFRKMAFKLINHSFGVFCLFFVSVLEITDSSKTLFLFDKNDLELSFFFLLNRIICWLSKGWHLSSVCLFFSIFPFADCFSCFSFFQVPLKAQSVKYNTHLSFAFTCLSCNTIFFSFSLFCLWSSCRNF